MHIVEQKYSSMSPTHKKIARYILDRPYGMLFSTARDLAKAIGCNVSSVVRFAQALGFNGFTDFRQAFRHYHLGLLRSEELVRATGEVPNARQVVRHEIENLKQLELTLDPSKIERAARSMLSAKRTLVVSSGSFAALGLVLTHLLGSIGLSINLEIRGGVYLAASLAHLEPKDMVVGIGFWRGHRNVMSALTWARDHDIHSLAITDSVFSPFAEVADEVLAAPSEGYIFIQSLSAGLALIYALVYAAWSIGQPETEKAYRRMNEAQATVGAYLDMPEST